MGWATERATRVGGRRLAYVEAGPRSAPRAVACVHGAGGGREGWLRFMRDLARRGIRSLAVDLPGHGRSPGPGCDDVGAYARLVGSFLLAAGLDRPILAGHSMGGAIALTSALETPDLLGGIALLGTGARLRVPDEILGGFLSDFERTVDRIIGDAFSPGAPPALCEEGRRQLLACPPEVVHGDFSACNRFDVMGRVQEISVPTLVICGEGDSLTPPRYSRYLAERIPGARLRLIGGAGHMVMLEDPASVGEAVAGFHRMQ